MKSLTIFLFFILSVYVSCQRARMLQKDSGWDYKLNCKNFDEATGTCQECFEGCTKWENICVKIVQHCAKWDDQGNCIDCEKGYGDMSNKSVDGACPKQAQQGTGGNATVGSEGNQTVTPMVDVNCQCHTEERICIDCFPGFYLDVNATCQELPGNCTAANKNGECTGCIEGFAVENGECVEKICDKSLCVTYNSDQTECTQCPQRSYLEGGCCYEVNGYCSAWVESSGECTACYQGYEINKDNRWECIPSASS